MRMTLEKLIDIIVSEREGPKLDFKWKPWDFKDEEKKGEFIKDLIAIANSQGKGILGGDEGHIIIGVEQIYVDNLSEREIALCRQRISHTNRSS